MSRIHSNNYLTTLASDVTNSAVTIVVTTVTGFPVIGAGVTCNLTLQTGNTLEIVKATSNSGTTITIVRAQEGTSGTAFLAGSTVSLRPTADSIDRKQDLISGASLTAVTVATDDKVVIQDTSDSNNIKTVTAQSIADLVASSPDVAITNDTTTNATMYPTWVTTNTGNLPVKVSSTKLSFNPSTAALTTTTFVGALSGNATTSTNTTGNAATVTTNANLTGVITSSGNATSIASQTGTGTKFVVDTSPTLVTPLLGTVTSGNISACTSTSMTMVTPILGTPTSGTLTNCTGLPLAGGVTGSLSTLNGGVIVDCYAASTAALTATYGNGSSGVGATLTNAAGQAAFSIDGQSPALNSRILIKNQASALQNGIYTLTTVGDGSHNWVLTRATDYDQVAEINIGDRVFIQNGTANVRTMWAQTTAMVAVGTTSNDWSRGWGATGIILPTTVGTNRFLICGATTDTVTAVGNTVCAVPVTNASATISMAACGTTGQLLRGSTSAAPAFSTSTYPDTNAINTLLYASSANTMAALATANSGVLITSSGGVPSISSTLPSGITLVAPALGTVASGVISACTSTSMVMVTPVLGAATGTSLVTTSNITTGDTFVANSPTPSNGSIQIYCTDNGSVKNLGITNAALGQNTTLTIPDPGSSTANFLLSKAAATQHITTFSWQIDAGALISGKSTGGSQGSLILYAPTSGQGLINLVANDNSGNRDIEIGNDSHGQSTTYNIPDCGASSNKIMTYDATNYATAGIGGGLTLPALAQGYIRIRLAGTFIKIPYYPDA